MNELIGNTPIIKINYKYQNEIKSVYAKLEYYNLTGSIKDRMAYYIIDKAYKNGDLKKGQPIIEATSGNTGISLSAIGALYNNPVYIFMPDWVSKERIKIMELYGAKVTLVSKKEGGFLECINRANTLAKSINGFTSNQFENKDNITAHYETTAKEIIDKFPQIDSFISGVGTGGTIMGVAKRLKEKNEKIKILALEPSSLPIISKGVKTGNHKIEGIGDEFMPKILDTNLIDDVILVEDIDAINMAKKLASKLGLGVGISSGANFLGAIMANQNNIATIFSDDLKKYLTTDLTEKITSKNLISNQIELIDYEIL